MLIALEYYSLVIFFQLHIFEKSTSSWLERGRGPLRLNDSRVSSAADDKSSKTSRIIMRTAGSLRVILNTKVFPEMTLEKPSEKNIRLTAMDGTVSESLVLDSFKPKLSLSLGSGYASVSCQWLSQRHRNLVYSVNQTNRQPQEEQRLHHN